MNSSISCHLTWLLVMMGILFDAVFPITFKSCQGLIFMFVFIRILAFVYH